MPRIGIYRQPGHENLEKSASAELAREPFELVLKNSIDEVFKYTLGEGGAQALRYHLKLGEDWEDPKEFHDRLISIMKDGALVLESLVIKELFRGLGLQYEDGQPFDFGERIAIAKKSYEGVKLKGATMR